MKKILIGSTNKSKIEFYRTILGMLNINVLTLKDVAPLSKVSEDLYDIVGNSIRKAVAYSNQSGIITLSDDTGIFIPALNNEPGIAVRRWGGKLAEDISDADWILFFQKKVQSLKPEDLICCKKQVVALAIPRVACFYLEFFTEGRIIFSDRIPEFTEGGPFSALFYIDEYKKFESELSDTERQELLDKLVKKLRSVIKMIYELKLHLG